MERWHLLVFHRDDTLFDSAAQLLVTDTDSQTCTQPTLHSGLYIVTTQGQTGVDHQIFILYWPEQTTWDDSTAASIHCNLITFMRFVRIHSI